MPTSLSQLRTEARQRADMEDSEFVSDSELTIYINDSYSELYDLLVSKFADYYVKTPASPPTFTVARGDSTYALPSDFYKLIGVDRQSNGSDYYTIRPYMFEERNSRNNTELYRGAHPKVRYRIIGAYLKFTPESEAAGNYRIWYVPNYTALSATSDTIDVHTDKWKQFIVVSTAIKMLQKEESDVTVLLNEKAELKRRIEEMAANRDVGEPERVTDVTASLSDDFLFSR
jgi:hypothetical protein